VTDRTLPLLDTAGAELDGAPEKALEALVRAYAARPCVELAELVERFEAVHPPPAFEGDTAAFVARARAASVVERGSLARAIVGPKSVDTVARLDALERLPLDPRVARALERLVREVPYTSNTARPVMSRVLAVFARVIDGAIAARVPEIEAGWKFRESQRDWMHTHLGRAVASVDRPPVVLDPAERARIAALAAQLGSPVVPAKGRRTEEALLAEVYAAPEDDAPRAVLADFLLEKGDPRGELIALQLRADKSKAELAREKALLAEHGKRWLGGLAEVWLVDVVFRRGFPAVVTARFRHHRDVEAHGDSPAWATIEEISWTTPGSSSPDQQRFLYHVPRHLRPRVVTTAAAGLAQLLERATPLPIESLTVFAFDDVELVARLKASPLFGAVRRLAFAEGLVPADLAEGWLARVPEIVLQTRDGKLGDWLRTCSARPTVTRFTWDERWLGRFHFLRGEDGLLSRLVIEPDHNWNEYSLARLELPDGWLTDVEVPKAQRRFAEPALERARRKEGAPPPTLEVEETTPVLEEVRAMHFGEGEVRLVSEGRLLAVDPGTTRTIRAHRINDGATAFAPDGREVASGASTDLEIRDASSGALRQQATMLSAVLELAFDTSGAWLLVSCRKEVAVVRRADLAIERRIPVGTYPRNVRFVALDGDLLVTVYGEPRLGLHLAGKKTPTRLSLPAVGTGVAMVREGPILVTHLQGAMLLDRAGEPLAETALEQPGSPMLSADGQRAAVHTRAGVVVLDLPSLQVRKRLPDAPGGGFAFSPDGRRLAMICDGALRVFEL